MAELDRAYIEHFGWGSIAVSNEGLPAKDKFEASHFDYKDGHFHVHAGAGSTLDLRSMLKDGNPYGHHLNLLKQSKPIEVKSHVEDKTYTQFWVSHDLEGNRLYEKWPERLADLPKWELLDEVTFQADETIMTWNGGSHPWRRIVDVPEMKRWLDSAKPGYRIYVVHRIGFVRTMPEARYWNESAGRYLEPTQDVVTEPLAASTIVIK